MALRWQAVVLLLLSVLFINCESTEKKLSDLNYHYRPEIWSVLDYLNGNPERLFNYNFGYFINAQERTDTVIYIEIEVEAECINQEICSTKILICRAFVENFSNPERIETLPGVECEPKLEAVPATPEYIDHTEDDVHIESTRETLATIGKEITEAESEDKLTDYAKLESDHNCAGCKIVMNLDAKNMPDFINLAMRHVESENLNKYALVKLIGMESWVNNVVNYHLLIEIAPTVCPKSSIITNLEYCSLDSNAYPEICSIKFKVKRAYRTITYNNCTESQVFSESVTRKLDNRNDLDNEIDVNNDYQKPSPGIFIPKREDISPNFDKIAETGNFEESEISAAKLLDLESQIIPTDASNVKQKPVLVETTKSGIDNSQLGVEDIPSLQTSTDSFKPDVISPNEHVTEEARKIINYNDDFIVAIPENTHKPIEERAKIEDTSDFVIDDQPAIINVGDSTEFVLNKSDESIKSKEEEEETSADSTDKQKTISEVRHKRETVSSESNSKESSEEIKKDRPTSIIAVTRKRRDLSSEESSETDEAINAKNVDAEETENSSNFIEIRKKREANKDDNDSSSSSSSSSSEEDDNNNNNNIEKEDNAKKDNKKKASSQDKKKGNLKNKNDDNTNNKDDSSSSSSSSSSEDDEDKNNRQKRDTNDDSSSSSSSSEDDDDKNGKETKQENKEDNYVDKKKANLTKNVHKKDVTTKNASNKKDDSSSSSSSSSSSEDEDDVNKREKRTANDKSNYNSKITECKNCEDFQEFRKKRGVPGAPFDATNDPAVKDLVKSTLLKLDAESNHPNKYKVINIIEAKKQIVSGVIFIIKCQIILTDCPKSNDLDSDLCSESKESTPKMCEMHIWKQVWLNKQETNVTCDGQHLYLNRKRRSIDYLLGQDDLLIGSFKQFMKQHNKIYSKKELKFRFKVFRENMKLVEILNKNEQGTATYGATKFADLTKEEFKKFTGYRPDLRNDNDIRFAQASIPKIELPTEFDWRKNNAVSEVKNQGSCGSCWAFSVTGNVEGQYAIKHGDLLEFSEQELVDCDKTDEGCNGGLMDNAYKVIEQMGGLELENDYPYDARDEKCHFNETMVRVQLSGALNISQDETDMAKWLTKNGPISIAINANAMQFYMGGVSHPFKFLCSAKNLDHGVLIVGYGVHTYPLFHKTLPYWIVKNSWGTSWGEQGYYRVYRGDGTCGVNQTPSSAIVE